MGLFRLSPKQPLMFKLLLSDAELCDAGSVTLDVLVHEVIEQTAALTDHKKQAVAAVVILLVNLQMLGELIDALGQDGNLHLGRTGVGFMGAVGLNNDLFSGLL